MRYRDLGAGGYWLKVAIFHTPLSFGAPFHNVHVEFRGEVNPEEARVTG